MKKIKLLILFLIIGINIHAQAQWEVETRRATELEKEEKWQEALLMRERAVRSAAEADKNTKTYLSALEKITRAELTLKTSANYKSIYDLMLSGANEMSDSETADPLEISKVHRRLGMIAFNHLQNKEDAYFHTLQSAEYHRKSEVVDSVMLSRTLQSLGALTRQMNRLEESLAHFDDFLQLHDKMAVKDTNLLASAYRDLSTLYDSRHLDIHRKRLEYLTRSKDIFESVENPNLNYLTVVYMELGVLETNLGNFSSAEGFLNKGIELYRANKEKTQQYRKGEIGNLLEIQYFINLIWLSSSSKNEKRMLEALESIETLERETKMTDADYNQYVSGLNLMGKYFSRENPDKAIPYFEKALRFNKKQKEQDNTSELTINLAEAYWQKKDHNKALGLIVSVENSLPINTVSRKNMYAVKAKSLFAMNKGDAALNKLQKLISEISPGYFDIRAGKPKAYQPGFGFHEARFYVDVSESIHSQEKHPKEIKEKLLWLALIQFENNIENMPLNENLKTIFEKIISRLMNVASSEREFSVEENNRLLAFMETVSSQDLINKFLLKREIAGNTQRYKLVEEEQYIRSYITFLKKELLKNESEDIRQQLFERKQQLQRINRQLVSRQNYFKPMADFPIDITNIGRNIIKFKVTGDDLFKTRIYNGKATHQKISGYTLLKQEITSFLNLINNLATPVETIKTAGEAIYDKLFASDFITGVPTVIIPDDILHHLPFEILATNGRYLMENHVVSYASNFYFLNAANTRPNNSKRKKAIFFAPEYSGSLHENQLAVRGETYSLKGAEEEVAEISKFIRGKVHSGNAASKSRFKSMDGDISILHLAMHSNLNDDDPELSNLLFSNTEEDYEMYISELYGLSFNADLAVLSACNTGVGGFKDGGNLVSMHHAFITAGIASTVSSLWSAPDQSSKEIMVAFYRSLQSGQDKATALQQAKLNYLKNIGDENLRHPFYWAGFVLSGDESPVQLSKIPFWKQSGFWIWALSILILGVVVVWRMRSGRSG